MDIVVAGSFAPAWSAVYLSAVGSQSCKITLLSSAI